MAVVQHRQIKDAVETTYTPHLDMSDVQDHTEDSQNNQALSRGLAAYTLSYLAEVDPKTAANAVVDGFGDGGIDAVYFNQADSTLYLLQSKWNHNHNGSMALGDTLKFCEGTKNLLNSKKNTFSGRILNSWNSVDKAINNSRRVQLVITYSGSEKLSSECVAAMENLIAEIDEERELVDYDVIKQDRLHNMLLQGAVGSPISADLTLRNWGKTSGDIVAYYGQISAVELANLHGKNGNRLFSRNIRSFLGSETAVNIAIQQTLLEYPEQFWFLNNGVTALANKVSRTAAGAGSRDLGVFNCEGLEVVNGAQTVGSISSTFRKNSNVEFPALVPIRIIDLESAPEGFSAIVTRTNNTQNRIDARNFVALDPEQDRLKAEFAIDGIDYEYRQGEVESQGKQKLGLVEATLALACTQDSADLAIQAKREIGKLWEDIERAPYKTLFNSGTTSSLIWNGVRIMRRVGKIIEAEEQKRDGKEAQCVIHGNRLIFHIVFQHIKSQSANPNYSDVTDAQIDKLVNSVSTKMSETIEADYSSSYLAILFKNRTKCLAIASKCNLTPTELVSVFDAPVLDP